MVYSSYSLMMFHFLEYFELFTAQYACFLVTYAEVTSDQHRQRSYCCVCVCVCVYMFCVCVPQCMFYHMILIMHLIVVHHRTIV